MLRSPLTTILGKVADPALAESIAGDLLEQRALRARRSRAGATAWYCAAAFAIVGHIVVRKASALVQNWRRSLAGLPGRPDLRHAIRSLRRSPWYAAAVIAVISLGLTLAATTFAIVDGVLFKPLPYPQANDLIFVQPGVSGTRGTPSVSWNTLNEWASAMPEAAFTGFDVESVSGLESVNESGLGAAMVLRNFFDVIGVLPLVGGFTRENYKGGTGTTPVIVSYELWQRRFGGAADILGRRLTVDPRLAPSGVVEVVGVMPRGFVFPHTINAQVLRPHLAAAARPEDRSLRVILRRAPGDRTHLAALEQQLESVMHVLAAGRDPAPAGNRFFGPFDEATVTPLADYLTGRSRPLVTAAFVAASVLLLIACLNVSGLVAARTIDRARELSLRRALGARAGDIIRATTAEAMVLLTIGGAAGLLLAGPMLHLLTGLLPNDLVLLKIPSIDWRVIVFVAAAVIASIAMVSILPVMRALRVGSIAATAATSRSATPAGRRAVPAVIVVLQVAAAVVLTVAGALLVASVTRVMSVDPGINPENLAIVELRIVPEGRSGAGEPTPGVAPRVGAFLDRVRAIPGVAAAGVVDAHILDGSLWTVANFVPPEPIKRIGHLGFPVSAGFFEAAGVPVKSGRLPTPAEFESGDMVAVVSEVVANAYWPGQSAIGQVIISRTGVGTSRRERVFTVVGVVAEAQYHGWDDDVAPIVYAPYAALNFSAAPVAFVRFARGAPRLLEPIIAAAERDAPNVQAVRAAFASTMLADTIRPRRLQSWLFGSFAAAALVIVGAGVLGLVAMTTARRTREVGIRMALGATSASVQRLILREQLTAVIAGVLIGAAGAFWAIGPVTSDLFEITPYDARVWTVAIALIVGVAVTGALLPARRASRVDPAVALRAE